MVKREAYKTDAKLNPFRCYNSAFSSFNRILQTLAGGKDDILTSCLVRGKKKML